MPEVGSQTSALRPPASDFPHAHAIAPADFLLRDDGTIGTPASGTARSDDQTPNAVLEAGAPHLTPDTPHLILHSDTPFLRLYHGNSLELLDAIAAKYPEGRFDMIFADPPYFLSNPESFRGCQRVLKPNGTIWVSGTHHVIFSIGYALQEFGYNPESFRGNDIAWEKPNPPPNLSCRYFTHSTETILWAAKNDKSKHTFNYQEMRKVTGKQMKTVWRKEEFPEGRVTRVPNQVPNQVPNPSDESGTRVTRPSDDENFPEGRATRVPNQPEESGTHVTRPSDDEFNPIWTLTAPGSGEKEHGKHPTQKPVTLIERCVLASTHEGDLVLDPFLGGGTTAVACVQLKRGCVGMELDFTHVALAAKRSEREIIEIVLRSLRVRIEVSVFGGARLRRVQFNLPQRKSRLADFNRARRGLQPMKPRQQRRSAARGCGHRNIRVALNQRYNLALANPTLTSFS
jgi:site-specific DNA-methyltransferase (adenine-specific)